MMVSDKHRVIWICVPGTGTRSFERAAKIAQMDFNLYSKDKHPETDIPMALHAPAFVVREVISKAIWNRYEKIAIIRNPYDWMNSIYHHHALKNIGMTAEDKPFDQFVKLNTKTPYYWYLDQQNNMLIDTLYKTEEINKLFHRFGLEPVHINKTSERKKKEEYTPELKKIMQERFWREFKHYE